MSLARKFFNAVFLLLVLQFAIPQELIHTFAGHEDSIDITNHNSDKNCFDKEHQHCFSLQLTIPPFVAQSPADCKLFFSFADRQSLFKETNFLSFFQKEHPVRGPPALV